MGNFKVRVLNSWICDGCQCDHHIYIYKYISYIYIYIYIYINFQVNLWVSLKVMVKLA